MALFGFSDQIDEEEMQRRAREEAAALQKLARAQDQSVAPQPYGAPPPIVSQQSPAADQGGGFRQSMRKDQFGEPYYNGPDPYGSPPPTIPDLGPDPEVPAEPGLWGRRGIIFRAIDKSNESDYNQKLAKYKTEMLKRQAALEDYKLKRQAWLDSQESGRHQALDEALIDERRGVADWREHQAAQGPKEPRQANPTAWSILANPQNYPPDLVEQAQRSVAHDYERTPLYGQPIQNTETGEWEFPDLRTGKFKGSGETGPRQRASGPPREGAGSKFNPTLWKQATESVRKPIGAEGFMEEPTPEEIAPAYEKLLEAEASSRGASSPSRKQAQAPTGQPVARAPKGTPDGPTLYKGKMAVVRQGVIYAQ